MTRLSVRTIYAIEHGDYSDRQTECLFENRVDAEGYVHALGVTIADAEARDEYVYPNDWVIVEYQLWVGVPVVNVSSSGWIDPPTLGEPQ
jgi:hypothetical protein